MRLSKFGGLLRASRPVSCPNISEILLNVPFSNTTPLHPTPPHPPLHSTPPHSTPPHLTPQSFTYLYKVQPISTPPHYTLQSSFHSKSLHSTKLTPLHATSLHPHHYVFVLLCSLFVIICFLCILF